jgi:hypothetical protein
LLKERVMVSPSGEPGRDVKKERLLQPNERLAESAWRSESCSRCHVSIYNALDATNMPNLRFS